MEISNFWMLVLPLIGGLVANLHSADYRAWLSWAFVSGVSWIMVLQIGLIPEQAVILVGIASILGFALPDIFRSTGCLLRRLSVPLMIVAGIWVAAVYTPGVLAYILCFALMVYGFYRVLVRSWR